MKRWKMKSKVKHGLESGVAARVIHIRKMFAFVLLVIAAALLIFARSERRVRAYWKEGCPSHFVGAAKLPSIQLNVEDDKEGDDSGNHEKTQVLIIACAAGAVLTVGVMIFVVIIVVSKRRRKSKKNISKKAADSNSSSENSNLNDRREGDKRRNSGYGADIVKKQRKSTDVPPTMMLWQITIRLTNIQNSQEVYEKNIDSTEDFASLSIGRGEHRQVDIKIYDNAVSDKHCEIMKKGNLYYIKDLNSTNGTKYNGGKVYDEAPITDSGLLKIGQNTYRLEVIDRVK